MTLSAISMTPHGRTVLIALSADRTMYLREMAAVIGCMASEIDSAAQHYQRDVMMIWSGPDTAVNAMATTLARPDDPRRGGLYRSLQGCGPGSHSAVAALHARHQRGGATYRRDVLTVLAARPHSGSALLVVAAGLGVAVPFAQIDHGQGGSLILGCRTGEVDGVEGAGGCCLHLEEALLQPRW